MPSAPRLSIHSVDLAVELAVRGAVLTSECCISRQLPNLSSA